MSEEDKAIEKRFEEVFGRKPGAFPEGTSLEEKVKIIGEKTKELEARKEKLAQEERDNLARLDEGLKRDGISINSITKQEQLAEEERANFARIEKQLKEDGISIEPKEPAQKRTPETSIQTDDKELNDAKGLQEDAKKPEEPAQKRTPETSIQTDGIKKGTSPEQAVSPAAKQTPEAKKIYPILDKGEQFNQDKEESGQFSKQYSSKIEEKQSDAPLHKHQKQPQQQENTQESQEKADIWSRFTHFVKKVLEKLIGEEDRVEHIKNEQEIPQKKPADNNKAQGKEDRVEHIKNEQEIPQKKPAVEREAQGKATSFIEINGKKFDLEPGKNFSYITNDKTLSINITYTHQPQLEVAQQNNLLQPKVAQQSNLSQPEVAQQNNFSQPKVVQQNNFSQPKVTQQNNLSQPKVAQQNNLSPASMNLNINGEGHSIPYGGNFSYKNNNVEINVTHGNQRERNYDEILKEARTMGKDLREHGAQMKERANNDFGHTTNTPDMQKSTGGHSR